MHKCCASSLAFVVVSVSVLACAGDDGRGNEAATTFETSGDGDGDNGDGDGDSGDGDGDGEGDGDGDGDGDPCAGIECSGHGTCVDDSGSLACACDDGYVAIGLECISCPVASGTLDIDIPMITVSGTKRVNGQPVMANNSGYMYLVNRLTGDSVSLGTMYTTDYTVRMIPGTYDLRYNENSDAPGLPDNFAAIVQEGIVLEASGSFDVDIPMITISGSKTVNGQPVMANNSGYMYLVNRTTGDSVSLGTMYTTDYSVELIPGTYDVRYNENSDAPGLPDNYAAIVIEGVELDSSGTFDIDIPMITVSGSKRVNGQTVMANNSGYMYFVNLATGDSVSLGTMYTTDYTVELIPGTYSLRYDENTDVVGLPDNSAAIVETDIQLVASGTHDIDIPMVTISGSKRVNGQTVMANNSGYMYFVNPSNGDGVSLGTMYTTDYSVELVPGTYSLRYDQNSDAPGLPDNAAAIIETDIQLVASGTHDIDIPMVTISGAKRINGQTIVANNSGYMYFGHPSSGDGVSLGSLYTSNYSIEIVPGSYVVRYDENTAAPGIPDNSRATVAADVSLDVSKTVDINVPMVTLAGERTINGQSVTASNSGYMYLVNRATSDGVDLGSLYSTSYSVELVPGIYEIRYNQNSDAPGIPENFAAILGCVQVQ